MSAVSMPQPVANPVLALIGVALVISIAALDSTIVGTTLPRVAAEFHGENQYAWVGIAYLLCNAVSIPISGRLGDLFGRKRFILGSLALTALGAIASSLSRDMGDLVMARAVQGVGGGVMVGTALTATSDLFPNPFERVRWQALVSTAYALASGLGPIVGGWMTEHFGWRGAFLVIPSVAALAFAAILAWFPSVVFAREDDPRVDVAGACLMIFALSLPLLALELGIHGYGSPIVAGGLLGAGAAAAWLLLKVEKDVDSPIIPVQLFRIPNVRLLMAMGAGIGGMMFVLIYYCPMLLQGGFGKSPKLAGALMTPMLVCIPLGSMVNGRLFNRVAFKPALMIVGAVMMALGCIGLMLATARTPDWMLGLSFALCGIGFGFQMPNLTLFTQMSVDAYHVGIASATVQTLRSIGSIVATAGVGVLIGAYGVVPGTQLATALAVAMCAISVWLCLCLDAEAFNEPGAPGAHRPGR